MTPKTIGGLSLAAVELAKFKTFFEQQRAAEQADVLVANNRNEDDERATKPNFNVYRHKSVEASLHQLFHGKCAYCESFYFSTAPVDTEHFRPKGRLQEAPDHGGYWWLAASWDNLLPSCIHCNRRSGHVVVKLCAQMIELVKEGGQGFGHTLVQSGKHDSFPILGLRATDSTPDCSSEYPLLLDPCRDNPSEHLRFNIDGKDLLGLVLPKDHDAAGLPLQDAEGVTDAMKAEIAQARAARLSVKGAVSIHVYGLNRLGLVQDRTRVLRHLVFLEGMVNEISSVMGELADRKGRFQKENQTIIQRLKTLRDHLLNHIIEMGSSKEPYSVMVQEWTADFLSRLKACRKP